MLTLGCALPSRAGEIEKFISETINSQQAESATIRQKAEDAAGNDLVGDEVQKLADNLPITDGGINDFCYYSYDKAGRLVSVEYDAAPGKNEKYAYDSNGNLVEKKIGSETFRYEYDSANQLLSMTSPEGRREYVYDGAGRLVAEKLNGKLDLEYRYGYLDKVIEVLHNGETVKFSYDAFGMLAEKKFSDGRIEKWLWDGITLIRRGSDIYVNEPHITGGVPLVSKTRDGVRCLEHDFLGTTLWSTDIKGEDVKDYQDTTVFGEGSIQQDRSARFTGRAYDDDLRAYVFPYRNYDAASAHWKSSDPLGYPDGVNQHFYAAVPTVALDVWGLDIYHYNDSSGAGGFGHSAWISGNKNDGYNVFDYGNAEGSSGSTKGGTNINGTHYNDLASAEAALQANRRSNTAERDENGNITQDGHGFDRSQSIATTPEQDAAFSEAAGRYGNEGYDLLDHNCYQQGIAGVDAANNADPEHSVDIARNKRPNKGFENNGERGWRNHPIER